MLFDGFIDILSGKKKNVPKLLFFCLVLRKHRKRIKYKNFRINFCFFKENVLFASEENDFSFTHIEVNITIFINSAYIKSKTTTNIILQFFCLMYFPCLSSIVQLFLINHGEREPSKLKHIFLIYCNKLGFAP